MEVMRLYAAMSRAAYTASTNPDLAQEEVDEYADNYHIVPHLSSATELVIHNPVAKEVVLAFRGTAELGDLKSDLRIAVGHHRIRGFAEDASMVRTVQRLFPNYALVLTGHSLGGQRALSLGRRLPDAEVHAFNPGAGMFDPVAGVANLVSSLQSEATIYSTVLDPLSLASLVGVEQKVYVRPTLSDPHSVDNFLVTYEATPIVHDEL